MSHRNVVVPMDSRTTVYVIRLLSAKDLQKRGPPRDSASAKEHRLGRAFGTRPVSRLQTWDIRFSAALALLRPNPSPGSPIAMSLSASNR
jgi:hypothetical protein